MKFTTPFADALTAWRQDRAVLLPLAGLTMFLPGYALMLLVPEWPQPEGGGGDSAATEAWLNAFSAWAGIYGWWFIAAQLAAMFGTLAVVAFRLDRQRPTVGGAALRAAGLLLRYVLATLLFAMPLGGLTLAVLAAPVLAPIAFAIGCYVFGRMLVVGPAIIVEAPLGAAAAVVRSWQLTRGHGWMLATTYASIVVASALTSGLFRAVPAVAGAPNPVIVGLLSGFAAAVTAASGLLLALVQVSLYDRLASKGT